MAAMSEEQAMNAMKLLAKLVAERNGFNNPEITLKDNKKAS